MANNLEQQWANVGLADTLQYAQPDTTTDKLTTLRNNAQAKMDRLAASGKVQADISNYQDVDYTGPQMKHGQQVTASGVHDFNNQRDVLGELFRDAAVYKNKAGEKVTLQRPEDAVYGPLLMEDFNQTVVPKNKYGQDDTRNAYFKQWGLDTANTSDDINKFGLARNDLNDEAIAKGITPESARYMNQKEFWPYKGPRYDKYGRDTAYDGTPGQAVSEDTAKVQFDQEFLNQPITQYELNRYMDRNVIDARVAKGAGKEFEDKYKELGSGGTEYTYAEQDPLTNPNDPAFTGELAEGVMTPSVPRGYNTAGEYVGENVPGYYVDENGVIQGTKKSGYLGNIVDAAQYGVGSSAARVGDMVGDAISRVAKETYKALSGKSEEEAGKAIGKILEGYGFDPKTANYIALDKYKTAKEYGYDDRRIQKYVNEFKNTFNDPNSTFADKALVTLKGIVHGPEVLASSSGDIMLGMTGIPGMAAMAAGQTNEVLNQRAENKGTTDLNTIDYTIATASGILYAAANMFTKGNVGLADAKNVIKEAASRMDKAALIAVTGRLVKDGLGEGLEEVFQGITEVVGSKLATPKQEEIATKETAIDLASQGALGFGGGVTGKTVSESKGMLTPTPKDKDKDKEAEATTEAPVETDKELHFQNTKDIYENAKKSNTPEAGIDLVNSTTELRKQYEDRGEVDSTDYTKVLKDQEESLKKVYDFAVNEAYSTVTAEATPEEISAAEANIGTILTQLGVSEDARKEIFSNQFQQAFGTIEEGGSTQIGDSSGAALTGGFAIPGLKAAVEEVQAGVQKTGGFNIPGMAQPKTEETAVGKTGGFTVPGPKTEGKTETETKKVIQDKIDEKSKVKTDADLGVGSEVKDGYVEGMSARTLNSLSKTFGLSPEAIRDAIEIAMPVVRVKLMKGVSKEADKVQREIYYGKDGMFPTYTAYKKAVQNGELDKAYKYIDKIAKRATEIEDDLNRHEQVMEQVTETANSTLKRYNDGKIDAKRALKELQLNKRVIGGNYTVTGLEAVYDKLTGELKDIAPEITSKAGEILQAKRETVMHYDQLLDHENIGRERPQYEKKAVADQIKAQKDKIESIKKEIAAQEDVIKNTEDVDDKTNEKNILKELKKELAKAEDAVKTYEEEYEGKKYVYTRIYPNKEEVAKKRKAEVEENLGQEVGTQTTEQAKKAKAKGQPVKEGTVKEVEKVADVAGIPAKLAQIKKLKDRAEKNLIKIKKNRELEKTLKDTNKKVYYGLKDRLETLYTELDALKARKAKAKAELKKAIKVEEELQAMVADTSATVDDVFNDVRQVEKELGAVPTATGMDYKAGKMKLAEVNTFAKAVVNKLNNLKKLVGITVLKVRRVLLNKKSSEIKAEIEYIDTSIADVEIAIKAKIQEAKGKLAEDIGKRAASKLINQVSKGMKQKIQLRLRAARTGKDERLNTKIWAKIKSIESELFGTRLTNQALNSSWVTEPTVEKSKEGNEADIYIAGMVKTKRSLFGQVDAVQLAELIDNKDVKAEYLNIVNTAVDTLSKVIAEPTKLGKTEGKYSTKEIVDNPALAILWDVKGGKLEMNKQVAAVIALVANEYIGNHGAGLIQNTKADVARMLQRLEEWQVSDAEFKVLKHGKLMVNEATSVGGQILRQLGIQKDGSTMPEGQYAQLASGLGMYALLYAQERGDIKNLKESQLTPEQWNVIKDESKKLTDPNQRVGMVKGLKGKKDRYLKLRDTMKAVNEALDIEDITRDYLTRPIDTENKKYEIRNGYGEIPDRNKAVMKKLDQEEWGVVEDALEEFTQLNDEQLQALMGWADPEDMKKEGKYLLADVEAQEAKNREIEESIDALRGVQARVDSGAIDNRLYFSWFFTQNGRYMIDSIGLNPQTDKRLSRFLVTPKANHNVEWDLTDMKDRLYFMSGVLQGLGIEIDGETTDTVETVGSKLLEAVKDKGFIEDMAKKLYAGEEVEFEGLTFAAEHPGHTMQAIAALKKYRESNGTKVRATVTMEFDAKTSGFAFKLLQLPFDDVEKQAKWLEKTAIYLGPDMLNKIAGKGSNDALKLIEDAYKTLGRSAQAGVDKMAKKDTIEDDAYSLWSALNKSEVALDSMLDKDGKVTKFARDLFKYPFMRFNYAESIESNKKSLAHDLTQKVLAKIADGSMNEENSAEFFKAIGKSAKDLREELTTKDVDKVKVTITKKYKTKEGKEGTYTGPVEIEKVLSNVFQASYGKVLEDVMVTEFGSMMEANDMAIAATQVMADGFIAELNKVKDKDMTSAQLKQYIEDLQKVFPIIKAPFSKERWEGITLIGSTRASQDQWKVTTHVTDTAAKGQDSLTVQSIIREFERAQASGAVIPTHWTDGSVISEVLINGGVLGIHDAIALGLGGRVTEDMVKEMNKATLEVSKNYNVLQSILEAYTESLTNMSDEAIQALNEAKSMVPMQILEDLTAMVNSYNKKRVEMFNTPIAVGNIVGYEGSVHYSEGMKDIKAILSKEELRAMGIKGIDPMDFNTIVDNITKECR